MYVMLSPIILASFFTIPFQIHPRVFIEAYLDRDKAHSQNFRCGWIRSVCREQSPRSLHDCLQQRRRWYHGVWSSGRILGRLQLVAALIFTFTPLYTLM